MAAPGAEVIAFPSAPAEVALPDAGTLEFALAPEDAARLWRLAALSSVRAGRVRAAPMHVVWHDTATGSLAGEGLALSQQRGFWRLERLDPGDGVAWLPAAPAPVLAEAPSPAALSHDLPEGLVAVAAFTGHRRTLALRGDAASSLVLLEGTLRGVAQDRQACRLILTGEIDAIAALARRLSEQLHLSVPRASLAATAIALAAGRPARPRRLGAASVPQASSVDAALTVVTAQLADVILHWSPLVPDAASPEPVHQMRVAVRRLRSTLSVFRHAAVDETTTGLGARLRALASGLGAARDWDVFLGGTGAEVAAAFEGDRRIAALMAAASRRQAACYAALGPLLSGQDWRRLELDLALLPALRPWAGNASPEHTALLASPTEDFARRVLSRRLKQVTSAGRDLAGVNGEALHEIRKQAKRLRYAGEIFAPLFSEKTARKYLSKLADVQEALGIVNDAAVAASLMAGLGSGADRAFAAGAVQGFTAARRTKASAAAAKAWRRFYRAEGFWS